MHEGPGSCPRILRDLNCLGVVEVIINKYLSGKVDDFSFFLKKNK